MELRKPEEKKQERGKSFTMLWHWSSWTDICASICNGVRIWQDHDKCLPNLFTSFCEVIRQRVARGPYFYLGLKYQKFITPYYSQYQPELDPSLHYTLLKKRLMCHQNMIIRLWLKTGWTCHEPCLSMVHLVWAFLCCTRHSEMEGRIHQVILNILLGKSHRHMQRNAVDQRCLQK